MKAIKSVFGKAIISVMIVFSLIAGSCNTRRSDEMRVRERNDGSEKVEIKQQRDNDSVSVDREKTIKQDDDGGYEVKEEKDVDRK